MSSGCSGFPSHHPRSLDVLAPPSTLRTPLLHARGVPAGTGTCLALSLAEASLLRPAEPWSLEGT